MSVDQSCFSVLTLSQEDTRSRCFQPVGFKSTCKIECFPNIGAHGFDNSIQITERSRPTKRKLNCRLKLGREDGVLSCLLGPTTGTGAAVAAHGAH